MMAAEVVHHQMDRLGFWILQGQVEQDLRELKSRPIRGGEGEMASRFGLYGAENIGGAAALIFTVLSCFQPRFGGEVGRTSACSVTGFSSKQTTGCTASYGRSYVSSTSS